MEENYLKQVVRKIRARSKENTEAMCRVEGLPAIQVGILRQELDSLVRVIYILSQSDEKYRNELIKNTSEGEVWRQKENRGKVTDRHMVDLANQLHGWTQSVYKFGCGFIHLSYLHDYATRDVLNALPIEERNSILEHLRYYHGGPSSADPKFSDIVSYFPGVLEKISGNLEFYLEQLERGEALDD